MSIKFTDAIDEIEPPIDPELATVDNSVEGRLGRLEDTVAESAKLVTEIHTAMVFLARQAQALQGSPLAKLLKIKAG